MENLIILPANHMSRYKNIELDQEIKAKIFGKLKAHTIESYVLAGRQSYPTSASKQESISSFFDGPPIIEMQSQSPRANEILSKYRYDLDSYKKQVSE